MYVSVTGLKPKGLMGWIRFLTLTMPASKDAQKAEGILHCAFNSRNGYQHTLTVWKSKEHMLGYLTSPSQLKAMKSFSKIGDGKFMATKQTVSQVGKMHLPSGIKMGACTSNCCKLVAR
jgi:phage-related tail fiber protein